MEELNNQIAGHIDRLPLIVLGLAFLFFLIPRKWKDKASMY
jgi:hypothetical protein